MAGFNVHSQGEHTLLGIETAKFGSRILQNIFVPLFVPLEGHFRDPSQERGMEA
jgi:hypothetical protein